MLLTTHHCRNLVFASISFHFSVARRCTCVRQQATKPTLHCCKMHVTIKTYEKFQPLLKNTHIQNYCLNHWRKEKAFPTSDRMNCPTLAQGSPPWLWNCELSLSSSANISRAGEMSSGFSFRPARKHHITHRIQIRKNILLALTTHITSLTVQKVINNQTLAYVCH